MGPEAILLGDWLPDYFSLAVRRCGLGTAERSEAYNVFIVVLRIGNGFSKFYPRTVSKPELGQLYDRRNGI